MRPVGVLLAWMLWLAAAPAGADGDWPVSGHRLLLNAPAGAEASVSATLRDPAIDPDRFDPTGGAAFRVGLSAAPERCRGEIALPGDRWFRLGPPGWTWAWVHFDWNATGYRLAFVAHRFAHVSASGGFGPCRLESPPEPVPIAAELRAGAERLCAAFGGTVEIDEPGRFHATHAPAPAACSDPDLTVANLNVLHGFGCGADQCRMVDRMELLADWIAGRGCPDVVALQEVALVPLRVDEAIVDAVAGRCPFEYEVFFQPVSGLDEEMILTRYPVLASQVQNLHLGFPAPIRHVTWVRVDHPIGPVDVFATHLASGADLATSPCENYWFPCPPECVSAGVATVRECEALQMAEFVATVHDGDAPAVVTGDFNAEPGSYEYDQFAGRGWLDTHLAAGNAECDAATGAGCTSGRATDLAELESTDPNVDRRIDFLFLVPPGPGSTCDALLDPASDADLDGIGTGPFAELPNPFAAACGAAPLPPCWPSDHVGNGLDLDCMP